MDDLVIQLWSFLTGFIPAEYLGIVGSVVVFANTITMFVATTSTNPAINMVLKVLNVLSVNIGKNKNADAG